MSGFLVQLIGSSAAMLPALLAQLLGAAEGATGGSLPVILAQLENAGFRDHVRSWFGQGENLPITAEHIAQAIPAEELDALATKFGVPRENVAALLAEVLPRVASHIGPEGLSPESPPKPEDVHGLVDRLLGR